MQKSVYTTDYKNDLSNNNDINSEIFQYQSHIKKSLESSNTASIYELYFMFDWKMSESFIKYDFMKSLKLTLPHRIWYPGEKGSNQCWNILWWTHHDHLQCKTCARKRGRSEWIVSTDKDRPKSFPCNTCSGLSPSWIKFFLYDAFF